MSEGYEKKDISIRAVAIGIIATVLLIVVFVVFLRGYFVLNYEKDLTEEIVNNPSQELQEILDKDKALLDNYGIIDKQKGIYQIPIDSAMKLVVQEYKNKQ